MKVGTSPNEIVMFPNVLIFLRQQVPTGGTKGTTVNHIAFAVRDVRQMRDKARAAGYPIVTREEAGAGDVVTDDVSFNKEQGSYSIFVMGPDDIKVQFFEVKNSPTPIALASHSFRRAGDGNARLVREGVRRKAREARRLRHRQPPRRRSLIRAGDERAGTRGHVLDHIGFEVKNLEAFCKKLESEGIKLDRPYTKVPALNIATAFIYDPVGNLHRADGRTRQGSVNSGRLRPPTDGRAASRSLSGCGRDRRPAA